MARILIKNGRLIDPAQKIDKIANLIIENGKIAGITSDTTPCDKLIDATGMIVSPGLIDMHVHIREPGREDKEDINTGLSAAIAGGFTTVGMMANTPNPIDNEAAISFVKYRAKTANLAKVEPYCAVTKGLKGTELTDFFIVSKAGASAFSDDGFPIMNAGVMLKALQYSRLVGKRIIAHEEDKALSAQGIINEGKISLLTGMKGIPAIAEEVMIARDLLIADYAKGKLHIAHLSTGGSADLIRSAKSKGIDVTCEVTPHHLILTEDQLATYDAKYKVNPPLRTKADCSALLQAINDNIIDAIASDHAPHTIDEKEDEIHNAPFGITGLETTVGILFKHLVHSKKVAVNKIIELLTSGPARVLGLQDRGTLKKGYCADVTIIDPELEWVVNTSEFKSRCRVSPYSGFNLKGKAVCVIVDGEVKMNCLKTTTGSEPAEEEIHLNDWT